jgi:hypothetical protein
MTRCAACLVAILAASCTGWEVTPHGEPPLVPEGCNPLAYEHDCMLPFPSDVFLQADADTPSGRRVVISDAAITRDTEGRPVDMLALHPADGFSPGSQLLALFPQGIDEGPLIGALDDPLRSLDDDSPTLLLDADSGERIMHLAETDPRALDDARRRTTFVRWCVGRRDDATSWPLPRCSTMRAEPSLRRAALPIFATAARRSRSPSATNATCLACSPRPASRGAS